MKIRDGWGGIIMIIALRVVVTAVAAVAFSVLVLVLTKITWELTTEGRHACYEITDEKSLLKLRN